jgi:hypothetical protein
MVDSLNRPIHRCPGAGRALALVALAIVLSLALSASAMAGPSPVSLGTAGDFAVLAGSAMTNTGVTSITGDVGSSPTHSETGFALCPAADCVDLTGANHDVADPNDAVTQQAKTDLVTAYDDALGRTGGTAVSAPLGGGSTLVSGLYTSATDIFVGGDLTLDAGGDPAAVFIFQAKTGTLTTAAGITAGIPNTRVLLTNGAQACNVFWQVGSSATVGTFTQFVGDILALQSITVNTSATLDTGRVLARNGAVTLDANVIRKASCAPPAGGGGGSPTPTPTPAPGPAATPSPSSPDAGTVSPAAPAEGPVVPPGAQATTLGAGGGAPSTGTASITGPSGTVTGPFTVWVTGEAISSVTFSIDGTHQITVHAVPGRTKFRIRINPRGQTPRVHRVTARVRFTPGGGQTTTRRLTYRPFAPLIPRSPRFTG